MPKKKSKLKLSKFVSSEELVSVFRKVPIVHLDEVREVAKRSAEKIGNKFKQKVSVRIRFRGPRTQSIFDTLREDAEAFDVYVYTKFSGKMKKQEKINEILLNRQDVQRMTMSHFNK